MIEYKNVAVVNIFNDAGELALQLRAANDDSFPLYWDFAAGGGIDEGEDSQVSATREVKEELGINVNPELVSTQHLEYQAWAPDTTRQVDIHIFKAIHNGPFNPDLKEVDKVEFFTIEQIQSMIDKGEKFHPEFLLTWDRSKQS